MYKYNYLFLYKQVIISRGFCQHFKYLETLLSSWINLWYVNILVHGLRFQTTLKIYCFKKWILRFCEMIIIQYRWKSICE